MFACIFLCLFLSVTVLCHSLDKKSVCSTTPVFVIFDYGNIFSREPLNCFEDDVKPGENSTADMLKVLQTAKAEAMWMNRDCSSYLNRTQFSAKCLDFQTSGGIRVGNGLSIVTHAVEMWRFAEMMRNVKIDAPLKIEVVYFAIGHRKEHSIENMSGHKNLSRIAVFHRGNENYTSWNRWKNGFAMQLEDFGVSSMRWAVEAALLCFEISANDTGNSTKPPGLQDCMMTMIRSRSNTLTSAQRITSDTTPSKNPNVATSQTAGHSSTEFPPVSTGISSTRLNRSELSTTTRAISTSTAKANESSARGGTTGSKMSLVSSTDSEVSTADNIQSTTYRSHSEPPEEFTTGESEASTTTSSKPTKNPTISLVTGTSAEKSSQSPSPTFAQRQTISDFVPTSSFKHSSTKDIRGQTESIWTSVKTPEAKRSTASSQSHENISTAAPGAKSTGLGPSSFKRSSAKDILGQTDSISTSVKVPSAKRSTVSPQIHPDISTAAPGAQSTELGPSSLKRSSAKDILGQTESISTSVKTPEAKRSTASSQIHPDISTTAPGAKIAGLEPPANEEGAFSATPRPSTKITQQSPTSGSVKEGAQGDSMSTYSFTVSSAVDSTSQIVATSVGRAEAKRSSVSSTAHQKMDTTAPEADATTSRGSKTKKASEAIQKATPTANPTSDGSKGNLDLTTLSVGIGVTGEWAPKNTSATPSSEDTVTANTTEVKENITVAENVTSSVGLPQNAITSTKAIKRALGENTKETKPVTSKSDVSKGSKPDEKVKTDGFSAWGLAAIVLCVIFTVIAVIFVILIIYMKRKRQKEEHSGNKSILIIKPKPSKGKTAAVVAELNEDDMVGGPPAKKVQSNSALPSATLEGVDPKLIRIIGELDKKVIPDIPPEQALPSADVKSPSLPKTFEGNGQPDPNDEAAYDIVRAQHGQFDEEHYSPGTHMGMPTPVPQEAREPQPPSVFESAIEPAGSPVHAQAQPKAPNPTAEPAVTVEQQPRNVHDPVKPGYPKISTKQAKEASMVESQSRADTEANESKSKINYDAV